MNKNVVIVVFLVTGVSAVSYCLGRRSVEPQTTTKAPSAPVDQLPQTETRTVSTTPPPPIPNASPLIVESKASSSDDSWIETFSNSNLDPDHWITYRDGDFKDSTVDVLTEKNNSTHLRLRANTLATRDDTVKFLGAHTAKPVHLVSGAKLSATLNWNNQANGCYLSLGLILCPTNVSANPLKEANSLRVEYIGVPPGKNGRVVVVSRAKSTDKYLYTEGWPELNRTGRPIAIQHVEIWVGDNGKFTIFENGTAIFESLEHALTFDVGYIYIQMSSHSNYPAREVYCDAVGYAAPNK